MFHCTQDNIKLVQIKYVGIVVITDLVLIASDLNQKACDLSEPFISVWLMSNHIKLKLDPTC